MPAFRLLLRFLVLAAAGVLLVAGVHFGWVRIAVWMMAGHWHDAPVAGPRLGLGDYTVAVEARPIRGLDRNTSGLSYSETSNTLFAVINGPPAVVELSTDGELLRQMPLPMLRDSEGIAHVADDLFVVADELDNSLHWVRIPRTGTTIRHEHSTRLPLRFTHRKNLGFEGISWDQTRQQLLVSNEKRPRRVLLVHGLIPFDARPLPSIEHWRPAHWFGFLGNDIASLTTSPPSGNLLLLSEESAVVTEYTHDGRIVGVMPLWAGASGLSHTLPQAEGIALGPDGSIYIVSEPNLFYRFSRSDAAEGLRHDGTMELARGIEPQTG